MGCEQSEIVPSVTLADVYRDTRVVNDRPSFRPFGVMGDDPIVWTARSGSLLTMTGGVILIAPEVTMDPAGEALIRSAGLPFADRDRVWTYRDADEYRNLLQQAPDGELVLYHLHPPEELPAGKYWIAPAIAGSLINKADLAQWIPSTLCPDRVVASRADAGQTAQPFLQADGRCVLKTTGAVPTGGGMGVEQVSHPDAFNESLARLTGDGPVVIERWYASPYSFCMNFALCETMPHQVIYLGAAEQIIHDQVKFKGNIFDPARQPSPEIIQAVTGTAMGILARGYTGLLGIDVLILEDQSGRIVDISPRLNASTVALAYVPALRKKLGAQVLLETVTLFLPRNRPGLLRAMEHEIRAQRLFPYRWTSCSERDPHLGKVLAIAAGESREALSAYAGHRHRLGFVS